MRLGRETEETRKAAEGARLVVAAHELGHALAWRTGGFPVGLIWIRGETGSSLRGATELGNHRLTDAGRMRAYLVGLLAGDVAGERWRDEHRFRGRLRGNVWDEQVYHKMMRHDLARSLTRTDLHRAAESEVSRQWVKVEQLAPLLAARGTLRL